MEALARFRCESVGLDRGKLRPPGSGAQIEEELANGGRWNEVRGMSGIEG